MTNVLYFDKYMLTPKSLFISESLQKWKNENLRCVWFKVHIKDAAWVPLLAAVINIFIIFYIPTQHIIKLHFNTSYLSFLDVVTYIYGSKIIL